MHVINQKWILIAGLQKGHSLYIVRTSLGQALNSRLGRTLLDGLLEIDQLLCIRQSLALINGYTELLPELNPIENISIKGGNIQLGKLRTLSISNSIRRISNDSRSTQLLHLTQTVKVSCSTSGCLTRRSSPSSRSRSIILS